MHRTTETEGLLKSDADLTPDERFREIAAILVAGILRLRARPESMPESAPGGAESDSKKLSDSARN